MPQKNPPHNNEPKPKASQSTCAICGKVVSKDGLPLRTDTGEILCSSCFVKHTIEHVSTNVATEVERASHASLNNYLLAFILGGVAAFVGGYIWYGITSASDTKWGIVALLIGAMVGFAVYFGSGRKLMWSFGFIGALAAVVGLLWGDYLIYKEMLSQAAYEAGVSLELAKLVFPFSEYLHETTGILDIIFYVLALVEGFAIGAGFITP